MSLFLFKRLITLIATLVGASVVVFLVLEILPGNAAQILMGPDASPEAVQALAAKLGIDRPPIERYWNWVSGMLVGDLGLSYAYSTPVAELVLERLSLTVPLALLAMAITTVLALAAGIYAAARHNKLGDVGVMGLSQIGIAIPNFWFAILLILLGSWHVAYQIMLMAISVAILLIALMAAGSIMMWLGVPFLDEVFAPGRDRPRWLVPFCHHPAFTAGPHHHNDEAQIDSLQRHNAMIQQQADSLLDPSALLNSLPQSDSTPELHLHLKEGENFQVMDKLHADAEFPGNERIITIDGLRVEYADGFGLARSSNTTPVIVLRFEAETPQALARIQGQFRDVILTAKPDAQLPF